MANRRVPYLYTKRGVFYLQKRVPADLKHRYGRQFIRKSLRTKDPKQANRLASSLVDGLEREWFDLHYSFPDDVLSELLRGIKDRHTKISHLICSGAGVHLIYLDGKVCEYVIEKFVERDTPILTVHDSFIVPFGTERKLDRVLKEAFEHVTHKTSVKAKYNQNLTEAQLYAGRAIDRVPVDSPASI